MSRHSARWTVRRRFMDRILGRTYPGKHHPIWTTPLKDLP